MKLYLAENIYLILVRLKIKKTLRKTINQDNNSSLEKYKKKEIFETVAYKVIQDVIYERIPKNNDYITNRIRPLIESEIEKTLRKYF